MVPGFRTIMAAIEDKYCPAAYIPFASCADLIYLL